jgi:hypothetical protein
MPVFVWATAAFLGAGHRGPAGQPLPGDGKPLRLRDRGCRLPPLQVAVPRGDWRSTAAWWRSAKRSPRPDRVGSGSAASQAAATSRRRRRSSPAPTLVGSPSGARVRSSTCASESDSWEELGQDYLLTKAQLGGRSSSTRRVTATTRCSPVRAPREALGDPPPAFSPASTTPEGRGARPAERLRRAGQVELNWCRVQPRGDGPKLLEKGRALVVGRPSRGAGLRTMSGP